MGLLLGLSGCAGWQPREEGAEDVETRVRAPAREESAGVQVFPLQNPAVKQLLADASAAESSGDYGQASMLLERALRIQPRDPELLQQMAEVQLQIGDFGQALNFAERSYDTGPRVGELCSRNWHTMAVARERLGDTGAARQARDRAGQCMNTKPASL
jgi:tetratricopeptide (TPR) repeat protein